jgi:ABC-2 type transport system ATP-binding protein
VSAGAAADGTPPNGGGPPPSPGGAPPNAGGAPPIEVRGLIKRYGELTAVAGVDLTVNTGDVYGYLGPNGAGKTTSLRMMLGLIRPTAGTVRLFGRDPMEGVRALDGVAGFVEAPTFYPYLNARRNLELLAAFDGHGAPERIDQALDTVELSSRAGDRVGGFSHGMRQRLGIAAALLRDPRLLLLDEPATGLDPAGMRDMRLLIHRLAGQGMTVLLSSHLLTEVEDVCNRVAIVRSGRIVYEGEIAALKRGAGISYRLETTDDQRALAVCRAQPGVTDSQIDEHGRIIFTADEAAAAELSQALVEAGALIRVLAPQRVTLEDLFFSFTEGDGQSPASPSPPDPAPKQPAAH